MMTYEFTGQVVTLIAVIWFIGNLTVFSFEIWWKVYKYFKGVPRMVKFVEQQMKNRGEGDANG